MVSSILQKVFGTRNEREIKKMQLVVMAINDLEPRLEKLSDQQLKAETQRFKQRLAAGETLDDLLVEAFAVVREVSKRTIRLRHFDVQLMGGIVLHQGKISEMKTGEGKTLVATLAIYLNALTSRGVHLVTVNDYLAKRDTLWMGPIYHFLGLTVGCIQHEAAFLYDPESPVADERYRNLRPVSRQEAYLADITYGTNNEFGFDYLRDNMAVHPEERVQRPFYYAIVDEVDSILIDEARTPLIISGPAEESTEMYYVIDGIIPHLRPDADYHVDEKLRTATLTEEGVGKVEKMLGVSNLYDERHIGLVHHVNQALRAHTLFRHDVDYVVKDREVIIVDEFTGRLMPGRRYSDGLHQALEAKERVPIANENQTLATITFQNYFRLYEKLAGMTGTAATEAEEFWEIYQLEVVVIPTHKPMIRIDYPDVIYRTEREKFQAIVEEVERLYRIGRPVLVGTISIEKNEKLSELLKHRGIPHQVLNAKYHEKEASIIARAGQKSAVTIATNMAGRGVDIVLGEGIVGLGGLHVIGSQRHEARRIDNQLRGRSGRQGDPGSSRFYLSLEDDLMRIFGSEKIGRVMDTLGLEEGQEITHHLITKAIERAQKAVEAQNFEIRKHLLEYDNVMNTQREMIYEQRRIILEGENLREYVLEMIEDVVNGYLAIYTNPELPPEDQDWKGLMDCIQQIFPTSFSSDELISFPKPDTVRKLMMEKIKDVYEEREKELGSSIMRQLEKIVTLHVVDSKWKDHLYAMDRLREGIGLRAYGQIEPLQAYKKEGYEMFQQMVERIKEDVARYIFRVQVVAEKPATYSRWPTDASPVRVGASDKISAPTNLPFARRTPPWGSPISQFSGQEISLRKRRKIGRNDPCPCGSGKKFKKCCGR